MLIRGHEFYSFFERDPQAGATDDISTKSPALTIPVISPPLLCYGFSLIYWKLDYGEFRIISAKNVSNRKEIAKIEA